MSAPDPLLRCPVCFRSRNADRDYPVIRKADFGEILFVKCECCGIFRISRDAAGRIERLAKNAQFRSWFRTRGTDSDDPGVVGSADIDRIAGGFPQYSVADKQLLLLTYLEEKSIFPGYIVPLNEQIDYPVNWSASIAEFEFHLQSLLDRKFALRLPTGVKLLPDGWNYIDANRVSRATGVQAFVAMSFSPSLLPAWQSAIAPAIIDAGYRPFRTDATLDLDRIDVRIMTEIRRSRLVIADVTEQRPGVYFEAGFALGLGIPVFWSVHKNDLDRVHFDTRQYNHIVWEDIQKLREELTYRLIAVLGKGNYAPSGTA